MPRFLISREKIHDHSALIDGQLFRHIRTVMRLGPGDMVVLFDGDGREYEAELREGPSPRELIARIHGSRAIPQGDTFPIILFQSLVKGSKLDWVIQKATELGVEAITPICTERAEVDPTRWSKEGKERLTRYQRIADTASEQCGRTIPPRIHPVASLSDALGSHRKTDMAVLLWESESDLTIDRILRGTAPGRLSLFVGPEGGFTESEVCLARKHGALCATLGKRILRAETAGIVACALFQYCWGDLGRV